MEEIIDLFIDTLTEVLPWIAVISVIANYFYNFSI